MRINPPVSTRSIIRNSNGIDRSVPLLLGNLIYWVCIKRSIIIAFGIVNGFENSQVNEHQPPRAVVLLPIQDEEERGPWALFFHDEHHDVRFAWYENDQFVRVSLYTNLSIPRCDISYTLFPFYEDLSHPRDTAGYSVWEYQQATIIIDNRHFRFWR